VTPRGRRVVVSGLGVISPVGNTVDDFWTALVAGRSGVGPISRFDASGLTASVAAEVKGFDPLEHADGRTVRTTDPSAIYLLAACREAIAGADLTAAPTDAGAVAVVVGLDVAQESLRRSALGLDRDGQLGVDSFALVQGLPDTAGSLVAHTWGFRGPLFALSAACASGVVCLLQAWNLIQLGYADAAVAGSTATLDALLVATCAAARILTRNPDPASASRPFDRLRDGFVIGEGASAVILETLEHAEARGAPVIAELLGGWQDSSTSGYTVNPAEDIGRCLRRALHTTGVDPSEIDLVGAHATSTPLGDRQEASALRDVFADRTVPAFAAKSMLGHGMSAAGGLETVALLLAMRDGIAPPTINYEHPDPDCVVDCIPNRARKMPVRTALKNSFGFGGVNCCLVFRGMNA
jgi:3-oxoacyl-[acyl-carrier-protein] synthase II